MIKYHDDVTSNKLHKNMTMFKETDKRNITREYYSYMYTNKEGDNIPMIIPTLEEKYPTVYSSIPYYNENGIIIDYIITKCNYIDKYFDQFLNKDIFEVCIYNGVNSEGTLDHFYIDKVDNVFSSYRLAEVENNKNILEMIKNQAPYASEETINYLYSKHKSISHLQRQGFLNNLNSNMRSPEDRYR